MNVFRNKQPFVHLQLPAAMRYEPLVMTGGTGGISQFLHTFRASSYFFPLLKVLVWESATLGQDLIKHDVWI